MTYYVGNMPVGEHLAHYGTKGMKWGHRRYQNPDGSLTAAGQARYNRYTSGANRARTMASMNRAAARRSKSRLARGIYNINDRYYTGRANRLTAKANRVKTGRSSNPNRSRNLRRAAAIAGGVALGAGAAYLGYKHRGQIKDAARRINALRAQRANAIKGYKQFGFENRGLTKFDKARIDLMRNAGQKASHLKYATGNKARAIGYKANAFKAKAKVNAGEAINRAKNGNFAKKASHLKYAAGNKARALGYKANAFKSKAKVNAGEAIGKAKSNLGKKASHLKYAAGNKARAISYKANAFRSKAQVNAGEAINKAKGKAKNFIADSRTRRAAKNSGKGYEAIRKKLNPQKVSGISNRMRRNVERLNNPAYQRRIRNAKAFGKGAAIGLGSAAAGLGAQALYDRYGRNRKLKSKRYKQRHSN